MNALRKKDDVLIKTKQTGFRARKAGNIYKDIVTLPLTITIIILNKKVEIYRKYFFKETVRLYW